MRTTSRAPLKGWLTRPSTGAAIALVVVGLLFALVEAQSPSRLYWTGDPVAGTNSGGIVYYTVRGEQYTLDDPGPVPEHDTPVTVYVDPADASNALLSKATRWVDAAAVLGWFVAALGCLVVPGLRRAAVVGRGSRRPKRAPEETSATDWIGHYLERPPARRPPDG